MDASLIANKVIDVMMKNKGKGILCKLYMEKAYEQISSDFILRVLRDMGFGSKWIHWCIPPPLSPLS